MKYRHSIMSRGCLFLPGIVFFTLLLCPFLVQAQDHTFPYSESFESYVVGADLSNVDGWHSSGAGAAMVVADAYSYGGPYPIPAAAHTKVLDLTGSDVTNRFINTTGRTNVWIDFMCKAIRTTTQPSNPTNAPYVILGGADKILQMAFYFDTGGQIVVYHSRFNMPGGAYNNTYSELWTTLANTPIANSNWVRVTIAMDYLTDSPVNFSTLWGDTFFTVALDNGTPLSHTNGWVGIPAFPESQATGPYFQCADACWGVRVSLGEPPPTYYFSEFQTHGVGRIDDLVITDTLAVDSTPPAYQSAAIDSGHKIVTLTFNETLTDNDVGNLTNNVLIAVDGSNFVALGVNDDVTINGSDLVVTFDVPLTTDMNKIKVLAGALSDAVGNPTAEVITEAIDAAADIVAPSFLSAGIDGSHTIVTLTFNEDIEDNTGDLKSNVMIATNGVSFLFLQPSDLVVISGSNLVFTFNQPLTSSNNLIKVVAGALSDAATNLTAEVITAIDASDDIIAPSYIPSSAILGPMHTNVTLSFDQDIEDNTGGSLTNFVQISTDGSPFVDVAGLATVNVAGSTLVITFNNALTAVDNVIKVLVDAIRDTSLQANVLTNEFMAESLDASSDIIAPSYIPASAVLGPMHTNVTLSFDEPIEDNTGGNLTNFVRISTDGSPFVDIAGLGTVSIVDSTNLVITFNSALTAVSNVIKVLADAIRDTSPQANVLTSEFDSESLDASGDILAPVYQFLQVEPLTNRLVTLVFDEAIADNTGGLLTNFVQISTNGTPFVDVASIGIIQINGNNLEITFNQQLSAATNVIKVLADAIRDTNTSFNVLTNEFQTAPFGPTPDITAPAYVSGSAILDSNTHKTVTLSFDEDIEDDTGGNLEGSIQISTNGSPFVNITGLGTVQISGASNLVITFNIALTAETNVIRVLTNTVRDAFGNITGQFDAEELDASEDIAAPSYIPGSAILDSNTHKIVTLSFNEPIEDNTGGSLTNYVQISTDGSPFVDIAGLGTVNVVASTNLVITFNDSLTAVSNVIKVLADAIRDMSPRANALTNEFMADSLDASEDILAPSYMSGSATLDSSTHKIVTLSFDEPIADNTGGSLTNFVKISTDGSPFVDVAGLGTVNVVASTNLVITFNNALTAVSNVIKVLADAIRDTSPRVNVLTNEFMADSLDASADITAPSYMSSSAILDSNTHKIVTLSFSEPIADNTGGSLTNFVRISTDGSPFVNVAGLATVNVAGSTNLVITFNNALTAVNNVIRILADAIRDTSPQANVLTTQFDAESLDASADIIPPGYVQATIDSTHKIVTLLFDEALQIPTGVNITNNVEISTNGGVDYVSLVAGDIVTINGSTLVITFNAELTSDNNVIKVLADSLEDAAGNKTAEVITEPINAAANVFRMKITFSGYNRPGTLTNFPALVVFDQTMTNFYNKFASPGNAGDLRFTDAMTNEINYEIEKWDTNGQSFVWVQVPTLSSSSDYIWAYWGDTNNMTPPAYTINGATWSEGYVSVLHMGESGSTTLRSDSTAYNNDATPVNYDGDEGTVGKIGDADYFDGATGPAGDALRILDAPSLNITNKITLSAWIKADAWNQGGTTDNVIIRKEEPYRLYNRRIDTGGNAMTMKIKTPTSHEVNYGISLMVPGQWYHVLGTYDSQVAGDNMFLYINGALVMQHASVDPIIVTNDDVYIGQKFDEGTLDYPFMGIIDEARISDVARSGDWVWASWMNEGSNAVFNTYAAPETVVIPDTTPPDYVSAAINGTRKIVTLTFNELLYDNTSGSLKNNVQIAENGVSFVALGGSDTVTIIGSTLVVTFDTALTSDNNVIKVLVNALRDAASNTTAEVVTESMDATVWAPIHRMKITFSGYNRAETLTNFPALVVFDQTMTNFYSGLAYPGNVGDLRFTDAMTNEINYEIEKWDTNGQSFVWVQIPALSSSTDYIWAYWGDPGKTNSPAYTTDGSTWSEGFAAVYHLNESGIGTRFDSTANNNHGTPQNYDNDEAVAGMIGGADNLNGIDDTILVPHDATLTMSDKITVSAWVKATAWDSPIGEDVIIRKSSGYRFMNRSNVTENMTLKLQSADGNMTVEHSIGNYTAGQWYYVVGTYDRFAGANNVRLYRNGTVAVQATGANAIDAGTDALYIGSKDGLAGAPGQYFNGIIDEARICNVARSADWIWANWMNQASNNVFLAYGLTEDMDTNTDTDSDGMPDTWETQYALNPNNAGDASEHADNDGLSNLGEYIAGTDPTNSASVFAISIVDSNGQIIVLFPTIDATGTGYIGLQRYYDLERSSDLIGGSWIPVTIDIPGDDSIFTHTNISGASVRFYRVRAKLQ